MAGGCALNREAARRPKVACRPLLVLQRRCCMQARAPPATTVMRSPARCRNSCARPPGPPYRGRQCSQTSAGFWEGGGLSGGSRALHPPSSASPTAGKAFLTSAQFLSWTGSSLHPVGVASSFPSVTTLQPWGFSPFIRCPSTSPLGQVLCSSVLQTSDHGHPLQKASATSLGHIPSFQPPKSLASSVGMKPTAVVLVRRLPLNLFLRVLVGPVDSCKLAGAEATAEGVVSSDLLLLRWERL